VLADVLRPVRLLNSSSRQLEPNCRRWLPITTWQVRCPVPPLLVMLEADTLT
jgi:hypothetical protein